MTLVTPERGGFVVACGLCGYRSVRFDQRAKANGAKTNHETAAGHRRRARQASLRRAA